MFIYLVEATTDWTQMELEIPNDVNSNYSVIFEAETFTSSASGINYGNALIEFSYAGITK